MPQISLLFYRSVFIFDTIPVMLYLSCLCCTGPGKSSTIVSSVYALCNTCSAYYWGVPGELADHGNLVHKNMWSASFFIQTLNCALEVQEEQRG